MSISNFFKNITSGNMFNGGWNTSSTPKPVIQNTTMAGPTKKPAAVVSSTPARKKVNEAISYANNLKKQSTTPDYMTMLSDSLTGKSKDEGDDEDSTIQKYIREIGKIQSGKFKYSGAEKAQLENIRATGRQLELRQSRVNDNYMGSTMQGEIISGRSRYAQEMADDALINSMQTGINAINEVDLETSKAVSELEQAIKEERMRAIAEKYGLIQEQEKNKQDSYNSIQQNLLDYAKLQQQILNADRDYNLEYQKYLLQKNKPVSSSKSSSSTGTGTTGRRVFVGK